MSNHSLIHPDGGPPKRSLSGGQKNQFTILWLNQTFPGILRTLALTLVCTTLLLCGCRHSGGNSNADTVTVLVENSPNSLDPRVGTDAVSERIDQLIFDSLVERTKNFGIGPDLALSWQTPNPETYIFHLRPHVYFQNGQPFTSRDVKWTLDSILNGSLISIKAGAFKHISSVGAPNPLTVIIHLDKPDPALLWNLTSSGIGIVPYGSGRNFWQHPIGTGPYRFVSQAIDQNIIVERSPNYWGPKPHIQKIRFDVAPDATTRALELEKGAADAAVNALSPDMNEALGKRPNLVVETGPGSEIEYLVFNLRAPYVSDVRVRRAIALAINRRLIIQTVLRGQARPANSLLPPRHWAWTGDVSKYPYNPAAANALLDQAGYKRGPDGVRFHISLKTSTDETTRLLAVVLQQQLARVGIALDLRSFEFATFYSDLTHGNFEVACSRWIGGNESPDIFRYAYATSSFPPHGSNRGFYSNAKLDTLLADADSTLNQQQRRADYVQVQQILARDLPTIDLWYLDTVIVHTRRLKNVQTSPSGDFNFLRTATVSR